MRKIILSAMLMCIALSAYCQSPGLVKREYFIDTDPGRGNGVNASFAACDSISESILSIPTTGLAVGSHTLYIRYADSSGVWGLTQAASFAVTGSFPEATAPRVTAREYFIDTDPGIGNGVSASFTAADSVTEPSITVSTTGLAGGPHALYIRYKDSVGRWGPTVPVYFSVTGMTPPAETVSPPLLAAEYYVDTDPGVGNGTPMVYPVADSISDTLDPISTVGLPAGPHAIYMRFADTAGKWSQAAILQFSIAGYPGPPEPVYPRLARCEYFIDTDPGVGNGMTRTYAYADSVSDTVMSISTAGLAPGQHYIFIRYADTAGRWGNLQSAIFTVTGGVTIAEQQSPRLRKREYFIDTDPGAGNGIVSLVAYADSTDETITGIATAGLAVGSHQLYIRYADSAGVWGTTQSIGFAVSGSFAETASPRIRKREYFVDTDPGPGNGTVSTVSYSDSLNDVFTISTTGLPLGAHIAYVRYADSLGNWGVVQSMPFTASTAPQQPAAAPLAKREYFFDTDPGPGGGIVSTVPVGDSISETISSISTTGLSVGYHVLYIRYADTAGKWGLLQSLPISITNTLVSTVERQSPRLRKREYFIDTDPGPGNGTVATFAYADSVADTILSISTTGLAQGQHLLFIRYADSTGKWGPTTAAAFAISGSATAAEAASPRLRRREYFIDTDPGTGNGTSFSFAAADSITENILSIPTTGLAAGYHTVNVRYADSMGVWGQVQSAIFTVTGTLPSFVEPQSAPISKREYFFDTDPGPGNGTLLSFAAVDSVADTILFIPTYGLDTGIHLLYIRYADTNGIWGQVQPVIVNLNAGLVAAESQSPRLYKREYYIDTDPGPGLGNVSTFAYADSVSDTALVISTTGLAPGGHVLFFRYADSSGVWGMPQYSFFNVFSLPPPEPQAPRMVKREYYIDADPGPGNGIASTFAACDTLFDTTFSVSTTGLSVGSHVLYMRFADSAGRWGLSQPALFNVVSPAAIAQPSSPRLYKREYYFDRDPGPGRGNVSILAYSDSISESILSISTDTFSVGAHIMYIRYADSAGRWGMPQSAIFNVVSVTATSERQSPKLKKGEYYIDTDPGPGNGTALPAFTMADSAVTNLSISTTGLSLGLHRAYIRYCDSAGVWGLPMSIPINACLPEITLSPISSVSGICQGATTTVSDTATGGTWSTSSAAIASINASGLVTGVSAGTAVLTYSKSNACGSAIVTQDMVVSNSHVNVTTATPTICSGTSAAVVASGATFYTWSPATGLNSTTASSVIASPLVSTTYTITGSDAYGCSNTTTRSITVNPSPTITFTPSPPYVCPGGSNTITANGAATYAWTPAVTFNNTSGSNVTVAPASYTVYTVTGLSTAGCLRTVTTGVSVLALPVVSAVSGDTIGCAGMLMHVSDTASGGTWSSSAPATVTISASGSWRGIAPGIATITYTKANPCFSAAASVTVSVVSNPTLTITAVNTPCSAHAGSIEMVTVPSSVMDYRVDGGAINQLAFTDTGYSFNTGILTSPHTYIILNSHNAVCSNTYNDTITITPTIMTWLGGVAGHATDWNYSANWSCGFVPDVVDDVVIGPSVNVPAMSAGNTGSTHNLSILSGAQVQLGYTAALNIKGDLRNNGVIAGDGHAFMAGAIPQKIAGRGTISNLEIKNANGVSVDTASKVYIKDALYLTTGTLTTNDSLELVSSDTTATARIAPILTLGTGISGKVITDQYVQGGYRRYRFVSHPFRDTMSLSQLQQYIDITGSGGATNGFTTTTTNASSAYWFNPYVGNSTLGYDPGWRPFTRITPGAADTNRFHPGQGIRLFFRGAKGEGLGWLGAVGMYTPSATVIKMKGNVNQGAVTIALKQGDSAAIQSYNMVGNPYASPVDVGNVIYQAATSGQVTGAAFYVWNPTVGAGGQYLAIPIGVSAPIHYNMQAYTAFQVLADHDGAELTFHESDKTADADNSLFRATSDMTTVSVYDSANHLWDKMDIHFSDDGTDGYDKRKDALKPMSVDFALYSITSNGDKVTIDDRPYKDGMVIPLGIASNYTQRFILRADNVAVPQGSQLLLHDKLFSKYVPFETGLAYPFDITKDRSSQGDNRFELMVTHKVAAADGVEVSVWPNPVSADVSVIMHSSGRTTGRIAIRDISGVSVYDKAIDMERYGVVKIPMSNYASGIYMIEVIANGQRTVKKLIKE